mmetsp:Transcript_25317/g.60978  ORF Transcript_25317/g.60978 Transcript_25317/m.60978 type:complete len:278 (-) Transcript_25317:44-877(-)
MTSIADGLQDVTRRLLLPALILLLQGPVLSSAVQSRQRVNSPRLRFDHFARSHPRPRLESHPLSGLPSVCGASRGYKNQDFGEYRRAIVRAGLDDDDDDLMAGLGFGDHGESADDSSPKYELKVKLGADESIGYEDGIRVDIVSSDGEEGNVVGFLSLSKDENNVNDLHIERFEVAPLEPFKRSLISGHMLDELASNRPINELHIDTMGWAEREGEGVLAKLRPLASLAERRDWNLYLTIRSGPGALEEKVLPSVLRGFGLEEASVLLKIRMAQKFA